MKVTITKARRIAASLESEMDRLYNRTVGSARRTYDSYEEAVRTTEDTILDFLDVYDKLAKTLCNIKTDIGVFNAEKLSQLMTEKRVLQKFERELTTSCLMAEPHKTESESGRVDFTSGISANMRELLRRKRLEITRKYQSREDSCAVLNSENTIEICDEDVAFLVDYGIIVE